jgi:hypothetical protein
LSVNVETNLLSLVSPWLDKFYQITTKNATWTLHTLYNHLNTPIVQICRKGLCSNFISCCRYNPSQDWSTTMLFNFLATVSRGTSVLLFMSTHQWVPCTIIFMVMKMKPLVWHSLVFVCWYHSGMLDESNCLVSKKKWKQLTVIFFICPIVIRHVVMLYQLG